MAKVQKSTDSSSLAEVVDRILDKGIVIDVWSSSRPRSMTTH
jgi:glycerol dehydrogenase-like iron-containing ADH family enzyme